MLYILTACNRPWNLVRIQPTIPKDCKWVIIFDGKVTNRPTEYGDIQMYDKNVRGSPRCKNYPMLNYALDHLPLQPDDWLYVIDDDNVVHPEWNQFVRPLLIPQYNFITWGQQRNPNAGPRKATALAPTLDPTVGKVDMASYAWRHGYKPHLRFRLRRRADGCFASALRPSTLCVNMCLCYYNYLVWAQKPEPKPAPVVPAPVMIRTRRLNLRQHARISTRLIRPKNLL